MICFLYIVLGGAKKIFNLLIAMIQICNYNIWFFKSYLMNDVMFFNNSEHQYKKALENFSAQWDKKWGSAGNQPAKKILIS